MCIRDRGDYIPADFYHCAKGMEEIPEGGKRCFACYRLRLTEAVRTAKEKGCDYVATTLSISPLKNAEKLNEIGEELAEQYGVCLLYTSTLPSKMVSSKQIPPVPSHGSDYAALQLSEEILLHNGLLLSLIHI